MGRIRKMSIEKTRDLQNMLFFGFRYCLGRTTTAPTIAKDFIINNLGVFEEWTLNKMIAEIEQAIEFELAGHECDIKVWRELQKMIKDYQNEL